VLLGCAMPMLLRPVNAKHYQVVGDAYIHGLADGQALVGKLEYPWQIRIKQKPFSNYTCLYCNFDEHIVTEEDPRAGSLPPDWVAEYSRPKLKYKNTVTGEELDSDPRFSPENLKARGTRLQTFTLV
jgi:hypothetical protein